MRGIILNYKTIKQIYAYNPEELTLDEINKFSKFEDKKVKINKKEFVNIINVLGDIINKGAFENLYDDQLFFINLSNSIAEFDVLTILLNNNKNIIVNIEIKNYKEISKKAEVQEKLEKQIQNRIDDHLQQMFIDDSYIVLGYINNIFYKGLYKGNELQIIDDNKMIEILKKCKYNSQAYSKIQISDNLSNIQGVYNKLKNNTFKMYTINKRILEKIYCFLEEDKKVIMCLAKPGYGKTVLALSLFFNNENAKLLILNQKFYNTFYMNEYYNSNKAFFGTDAYISHLNNNTIAIIDEAQRLGKDDLRKIINKSKAVVLFGDTGQAFMITDEFITEEMYEEAIKEIVGNQYEKIRLKSPIRYSAEVDRALKYLYDKRTERRDLRRIVNFNINVFNTEEEFFREYNRIAESKKIFKMYTARNLDVDISVKINGNVYSYIMADRDYWNFSISGNIPAFGHTLHAISFDIENVFLYLDNLIYSEERGMPVPDNIDIADDIAFQKYINELDILLTRAKKSLYIYVDDLRTFLWFNEKISDINTASEILNE